MDTGQLKSIIEAALLAYGQPLGVEQLRELFDEFEAGVCRSGGNSPRGYRSSGRSARPAIRARSSKRSP
jgi:chromosome segregation and condensation protein ScpB